MDWQIVLSLATLLVGSGGIVAYIKARSQVRNDNHSADVAALQQTITTLQESHKELQDRYQEVIKDNDDRCSKLAERLQYLEIEYVKQSQLAAESKTKIAQLEFQLDKAHHRIEMLECELQKRDSKILDLEQQNLELRKRDGQRVGLDI